MVAEMFPLFPFLRVIDNKLQCLRGIIFLTVQLGGMESDPHSWKLIIDSNLKI